MHYLMGTGHVGIVTWLMHSLWRTHIEASLQMYFSEISSTTCRRLRSSIAGCTHANTGVGSPEDAR